MLEIVLVWSPPASSHKLGSELQPLHPEAPVLVDQPDQGGRLGGAAGLGGETVQLQLQLPAELVEVVLSQLGGIINH